MSWTEYYVCAGGDASHRGTGLIVVAYEDAWCVDGVVEKDGGHPSIKFMARASNRCDPVHTCFVVVCYHIWHHATALACSSAYHGAIELLFRKRKQM